MGRYNSHGRVGSDLGGELEPPRPSGLVSLARAVIDGVPRYG
jgi:hypothetical protein